MQPPWPDPGDLQPPLTPVGGEVLLAWTESLETEDLRTVKTHNPLLAGLYRSNWTVPGTRVDRA
jgi:hypothetical protein